MANYHGVVMRVLTIIISILIGVSTALAADAPNVTNISVEHRNGQTFITWTDSLTGASGQSLRYKIYRATSQITDTTTATLIADGVLNNSGQLDTGQLNSTTRINASQEMAIIEDSGSALSDWTGLAVYTATATESAYYAVITYEPSGSTYATPSPISAGNNATTVAVGETVASIEPVKQKTNTNSSTSFSGSGLPLVLNLHASSASGSFPYGHSSTVGDLYAYWGDTDMHWQDGVQGIFTVWQDQTTTPNQVVLYPRDTVYNKAGSGALETMWFGLSTDLLGESGDNIAYNFTEDKLDYLVPWVSGEYNVDTNKIYATGGSMGAWGSISYAFRRPNTFAAVFPDRPRWIQKTIADTDTGGNTTATATVPMMPDGTTAYLDQQNAIDFIEDANTNNDPLPPVAWGIGSNDGYATWQEQLDAVTALDRKSVV